MTQEAQVGVIIKDLFPIWEPDDYTKKSGETSFTTTLWKDGVVSSVSVSVTEIGTSGMYQASFTPDGIGSWYLEVKVPYNSYVWKGEYLVGLDHPTAQMNVAYDESTSIMYMSVWMDREGESVPGSDHVSCEVKLYDVGGTLLFTATSSSIGADGRFHLQETLGLVSDRTYSAIVVVTDSISSVTTNQEITTVG